MVAVNVPSEAVRTSVYKFMLQNACEFGVLRDSNNTCQKLYTPTVKRSGLFILRIFLWGVLQKVYIVRRLERERNPTITMRVGFRSRSTRPTQKFTGVKIIAKK